MDFSVIIPTYNRSRVLDLTLAALGAQSGRLQFEVIVVDDGSTDDTADCVQHRIPSFPVALTYLHQENKKQGTARNLGVSQAAGRHILFLGDDTVPASDFMERHDEAHAEYAAVSDVVIGYTPWASSLQVTRFMDYVGEMGWQFGFSLIEDPANVPFNFFYTSNLSMKRSFFDGAGGFDEDFQEYGWEDVELSWRLQQEGMRLRFKREAVAEHHHQTSFRSFVRRQRQVGSSAWTFYQKHPELERFLNVQAAPRYTLAKRLQMGTLARLCQFTEKASWPDLSGFYPDLMTYYYNLGILEARDD